MYLGRRRLGQEVAFSLVASDSASGIASWPSSVPTLDIWKGTTLVVAGLKMPKIDSAQVGLFKRNVFLDERFTAGYHEAVVRWIQGSYYGVLMARFQVIAGGDANGSVIALAHVESPHARFLVYQTDAGRLKRGKNPTI